MMNQTANMLARAILRRLVDTGSRQAAQLEVTKGELVDDVPRIQNYGLTGVPPVQGTDAIVVFLGGDREQGIIIAMENKQYRLASLEAGEVALYDDLGNMVKLGRSKLEVVAVTEVDIIAPTVSVKATQVNIEAERTDIAGQLFNNGVNVGSTHRHLGQPSAPLGPITPTGVPQP